jgi:hypothetical protein
MDKSSKAVPPVEETCEQRRRRMKTEAQRRRRVQMLEEDIAAVTRRDTEHKMCSRENQGTEFEETRLERRRRLNREAERRRRARMNLEEKAMLAENRRRRIENQGTEFRMDSNEETCLERVRRLNREAARRRWAQLTPVEKRKRCKEDYERQLKRLRNSQGKKFEEKRKILLEGNKYRKPYIRRACRDSGAVTSEETNRGKNL